jgi:RNA polymerase sigma factor (sigma-70 family)
MAHYAKEDFSTIYHATFNQVSKYVFFKVAQMSDAEDIVQSVYMNFYQYVLKKGKALDNVQAYLIQMANNELSRYYESKANQPLQFSDEEVDILENIPDAYNLELDIFDQLEVQSIWKLVLNLAVIDQKILSARFRFELSFKEIAEQLELSESTIKTRYYRAIEQLKSMIETK